LQPAAGHYGVFNGSRFRAEIVPKINRFIATQQRPKGLLGRSFIRMS
jgi:poly(3-hydroxybutyrate) depolymerase